MIAVTFMHLCMLLYLTIYDCHDIYVPYLCYCIYLIAQRGVFKFKNVKVFMAHKSYNVKRDRNVNHCRIGNLFEHMV